MAQFRSELRHSIICLLMFCRSFKACHPERSVPQERAVEGPAFCQMSERRYFTYIVASRSHTLYIGVTNNIEKRIREHRDGALEGFSKQYLCHRLVWFEAFGYINDAIAREK